MENIVTTNAPEYRNALIKWMATFGKNARETIRTQGRLIGERMVSFTPPRNQKQGKDAVRRDIEKIFLGIDDDQVDDKLHFVLKGNTDVVRAYVDRQGTVFGVARENYKPDATQDELSAFHQSQRDQRGRVSGGGRKPQDMGRWKFILMFVTRQSTLAGYIRSVQARVGSGKGGWAEGVIELGGRVPQWIAARARQSGKLINQTEAANPSVEFINASEWASGGDQDRVMSNAVVARIDSIRRDIRRSVRCAGKPLT